MEKKTAQKKHRMIIRDSIQGVTKPAIQRLCKIAGIVRVSSTVYEEIRGLLLLYMREVVSDSVNAMEYARRVRLQRSDLEIALQSQGLFLGAGLKESKSTFSSCNLSKPVKTITEGETKKKHRFRSGTVALRDVRKLQKSSDCLAIPKISFLRLTREVGQDYRDDLTYSKKFVELLQLSAESHIIKILGNANICAIHAGRKTVEPKDIQLSRTIMGLRS